MKTKCPTLTINFELNLKLILNVNNLSHSPEKFVGINFIFEDT